MILTNLVFFTIVLILLMGGADIWLETLNAKEVKANQASVPEAYSDIIDDDDYQKSIRYTLDKISFSIYEKFFGFAVVLVLVLFGIYPILFRFFIGIFGSGIWSQSLTLLLTSIIVSFTSLPFDWYNQFVLEQKYGFNKSTTSLWIADKFKEIIIALIMGVPLLTLLLWFFRAMPDTWWIFGFCAIAVFQIVMLIIYPRVILPLFNKLSELEEGELKTRLLKMADRAGFKASTIYVMDGSKRSSHSNAFFTGFGKFRKIILFDTLINQLSPEQIEAVLAHEIGHYKRGHIPKMIISNFVMTFVALGLIAYFAKCDWIYKGFGFDISDGMAAAILIFIIVASPINFWLNPIKNAIYRKYEYEADAFAKKICGGEKSLIEALRKMHTKNLSNLTPHRLYSAFHYSHPTLIEREKALKEE